MRLIITESQFNRLVSEQVPGLTQSYDYQKPAAIKAAGDQAVKAVKSLTPHDIMAISALAASVIIPFPGGAAVAAVIGALDAYQYKLEKNRKMAGLTLMFAALPGIIGVVNKIPGIKQLGAKGMTVLADKVSKGVTALAPEESAIVTAIKNNLPLIQSEYQGWVKKTADTIASKAKSQVKGDVASKVYDYNQEHPGQIKKVAAASAAAMVPAVNVGMSAYKGLKQAGKI